MQSESARNREGARWKPVTVAVMALVASIADATETTVQVGEDGFFGAPSSEPPPPPPSEGGSEPPPPPPPPKYWCGPGFWLNNAASFGAGAWPVSEHTYYDYNSTAGRLAGCPVGVGNPTLLQALQNPKLYFGSKFQGAGFNCVADYLTAKTGLAGTASDNNGVCSIDQLGRPIG